MLYLLLTAWLWWTSLPTLNQISRNNQIRREAESAYRLRQYAQAARLYAELTRVAGTTDPAVRLNLGHAYFQLGQYRRARPQYQALLQADQASLRTQAATQLGIMACASRDSAQALALFERALREDPANESARYDYEMIRTTYSGKPPVQPPRARAPKPMPKPKPAGGQEVERSSRQDELLRRFERLNLSEEQARQLLDALQADDLPYALTQSARKPETNASTTSRW
ncbi:hypothetical protein GCM10027578_15720 [Spirosoma luteolum]